MFLGLDATILARIQFAFTVTFHIIFPAFTIGLASYIATLEAIWFFRGDARYHRLARFWTKIFAVSFAMGVVSGLPMSYQFGTNWSRFSMAAGNVIGPLLGYEVLTAFFLEAKLPRHHALRLEPRAQGPALFRKPDGRLRHAAFRLLDPGGEQLDAIPDRPRDQGWHRHSRRLGAGHLQPDLPSPLRAHGDCRLSHHFDCRARDRRAVRLAGVYPEESRIMVRMGLGLALVLAPLQLFIGDQHGLVTAEYQPAKLAAMEGHWDGSKPGELVLFGDPGRGGTTKRLRNRDSPFGEPDYHA